MAIWTVDQFKVKVNISFHSLGKNMAVVVAALQDYWDNKCNLNSTDEKVRLQALFNIVKRSNEWLELKALDGKATEEDNKLTNYGRRKMEITVLKNLAIREMANVNGNVHRAFTRFNQRKNAFLLNPVARQLTPLQAGYAVERQLYENWGKVKGFSVSASSVHTIVSNARQQNDQEILNLIGNRTFDQLTEDDFLKLYPFLGNEPTTVSFLNKIQRMRYLITVTGGLLCDVNAHPISMLGQGIGGYFIVPYVMDKYGNLYVNNGDPGETLVVQQTTHKRPLKRAVRKIETVNSGRWNHSSFLGGAPVLCAGCLHIGYDCQAAQPAAGVLSAIDNMSGHYQPNETALRECIAVLINEGVNLNHTRIGVAAPNQTLNFYWGQAFLNNMPHTGWSLDSMGPHNIPVNAPPIKTTAQ